MKKIAILLFFGVGLTLPLCAQHIFNGQNIVRATVNPVTNVLQINGADYNGTKDSLLAMYGRTRLRQPISTLQVYLGVRKSIGRIRRSKTEEIIEVTTFVQQVGTYMDGLWLKDQTVAYHPEEIVIVEGKVPERF